LDLKAKRLTRAAALLLAAALVILSCAGCVKQGERNPTATIRFSNGVEIVARLYYDKAPNTVKNFISLAQSGFYDGLKIYRVVRYALVQMGDPNNDGTGNAGYYIKGEFANNGYKKNDLSHVQGTLSMARLGSANNDAAYYDTGSSSFFITVADRTSLDGDYAAFGRIIRGLDDFVKLGRLEVDDNHMPLDEITIESITIDTYGRDLGEPKTIALPN